MATLLKIYCTQLKLAWQLDIKTKQSVPTTKGQKTIPFPVSGLQCCVFHVIRSFTTIFPLLSSPLLCSPLLSLLTVICVLFLTSNLLLLICCVLREQIYVTMRTVCNKIKFPQWGRTWRCRLWMHASVRHMDFDACCPFIHSDSYFVPEK